MSHIEENIANSLSNVCYSLKRNGLMRTAFQEALDWWNRLSEAGKAQFPVPKSDGEIFTYWYNPAEYAINPIKENIMKKILIIGQAPPAQKQTVPYDTTLLYDMLSWINVTKERAQEIFDFEAMSNKFPGYGPNGHLQPLREDVLAHWNSTLKQKVIDADQIILLGAVAFNWFYELSGTNQIPWINKTVIRLIHPSTRNTATIRKTKKLITLDLEKLKIE